MERIEQIAGTIKGAFGGFKEIRAAYLYGSMLTDRFSEQSDIDVLFIVDDVDDRPSLLRTVKAAISGVRGLKLDVNVVFLNEFARRWHVYRPPTYFLGIKFRSKLLWGDDLLKGVKEGEITADDIYKRLVDLAQSSRAIYLNGKDPAFWETKYVKWLRISALEALYLLGAFELDFKAGEPLLCVKAPELALIKSLHELKLPMSRISEIAETLAGFVYKKFIVKQ